MRSEDMHLSDSFHIVGSRRRLHGLTSELCNERGYRTDDQLGRSVGNPSYAEPDHPWSELPRGRAREVAHEERVSTPHEKGGDSVSLPTCHHVVLPALEPSPNGWNSVLKYLPRPLVGDGKCLTS